MKMRLDGDSGVLEFERCEVGKAGGPVDPDVLLSITVKVANYSAADQVWIAAPDLSEFSENLHRLESRRQGEAILSGASADDLMLKFYSTDSVGFAFMKKGSCSVNASTVLAGRPGPARIF